jgi:hypothetical protein
VLPLAASDGETPEPPPLSSLISSPGTHKEILAPASVEAQTLVLDAFRGEWEGAFVRLNSVQLVTIRLFERDGHLEGVEQR